MSLGRQGELVFIQYLLIFSPLSCHLACALIRSDLPFFSSRCCSWCCRIAILVLCSCSVSRFGCCSSSAMSFFSDLIFCDIRASWDFPVLFATFTMSFFSESHLFCMIVVLGCGSFSCSWKACPSLSICSSSASSVVRNSSRVHLPVPMYGVYGGTILARTILWSDGIMVSVAFQS